ncbi:MAG: 4Fe-4S binding protein [Nanoarchaeota archaeon]
MIYVIIFATGIAVLFGLILAIASKKMQPSEDELTKKIKEVLPGRNCGGCGFANCTEYAKAAAKDPSLVGKCVLADEGINKKLSELTGSNINSDKKTAEVMCRGESYEKAHYKGVSSCKAALLLGNFKACSFGCLGLGDCVIACEYNAIEIIDGVAVVDENKCVGCGRCAKACPQGLIKITPSKNVITVKCSSTKDKKTKAKECKNSCIGCGMCLKVCPTEAIKIENDLAIIDHEKCTHCGACAKKCPRGVIQNKSNLKNNN